jgi:hypothetical protein
MNRIHTPFLLALTLLLTLAEVSCARRNPNVYPLDKSYYNEKTLESTLTELTSTQPDVFKLHILGYTQTDKLPIRAMQIQTDLNRIPVLIIGQHHGDEVMGLEIALSFAQRLAQAQSDSVMQKLLDRYSFWIIPTLNPEGWKVVTQGRYQWKRKNNTDTDGNKKLHVKKDGVDLNRNYPTFWNLDKPKSPHHLNYKGSAPASEAEIKAVMKLAELVDFRYAFFYHTSVTGTYSEKLYLPWTDPKSYSRRAQFDSLLSLAQTYAALTPADYKSGTYTVHTGTSSRVGNARNHFFHQYGTLALNIEACGVDRYGVSVVHPAHVMKEKIVHKHIRSLSQTLLSAFKD